MLVRLTVLLVVGFAVSTVSAQKEICEKYSQCLEEVKSKESQCQQEKPQREAPSDPARAKCIEDVKAKAEAVKAAKQKKVDAFGTCINSKAASAVFANDKKKERCEALMAKQSRLKRQNSGEEAEEAKPAKAGRRGGRRGRPEAAGQKDASCRTELRQARAKCARMLRCCSVAKDCRAGGASFDQEIKAARTALQAQNRQCRGAKAASKKGSARRAGKSRANAEAAPAPAAAAAAAAKPAASATKN